MSPNLFAIGPAFDAVRLRPAFLDRPAAQAAFAVLLSRLTIPAKTLAVATLGAVVPLGGQPLPRTPPAPRATPPEEPDPILLSPSRPKPLSTLR